MEPSNISLPPQGIEGEGYTGPLVVRIIMVVFLSIAFYNAIELVILIFITFTHFRGLYFWTMLLSSTIGVVPHALGFLLEFFNIGPLPLAITLSTIGWYVMVPGQSVVLYSRLHLVAQNQKILRGVLWLIIIDAIILLIPTTVLTYSTAFASNPSIDEGYNVMERMQLTWFCVQEFIISGIYIWETVKILRLSPGKDPQRNHIMYELITINLVIILMDVALLILEYIGLYVLQTTIKGAVYSVKLKLELGVLGKLVAFVQRRRSERGDATQEEYPAFVNPSQLTGDVTRAAPVESRGPHLRQRPNAISMDDLEPRSEDPSISMDTTRPLSPTNSRPISQSKSRRLSDANNWPLSQAYTRRLSGSNNWPLSQQNTRRLSDTNSRPVTPTNTRPP